MLRVNYNVNNRNSDAMKLLQVHLIQLVRRKVTGYPWFQQLGNGVHRYERKWLVVSGPWSEKTVIGGNATSRPRALRVAQRLKAHQLLPRYGIAEAMS